MTFVTYLLQLKISRESQNAALRISFRLSMCKVVFTKLWHYHYCHYCHNHYCHYDYCDYYNYIPLKIHPSANPPFYTGITYESCACSFGFYTLFTHGENNVSKCKLHKLNWSVLEVFNIFLRYIISAVRESESNKLWHCF